MDDSPISGDERNPVHPKALTKNELTVGRRIVLRPVVHFDARVRVVVSEPVPYAQHPSSPKRELVPNGSLSDDSFTAFSLSMGALGESLCVDLQVEETGEIEMMFLQDIGVIDDLMWVDNYTLDVSDATD